MRRRYELSDRQWERLAPLLPHPTHHGGKGHPWRPHRRLLNAILWILHTGAPWRDLPERYGPWQTAYDRFNRWRQDGTWAKILARLLAHLERHGRLGRHLWFVDASVIRATRAAGGAEKNPDLPAVLAGPKPAQLEEPADHALGYSRGGFGSKIHLLVESHGIPLGVSVTPGQQHESTAFETLMGRVLLPHRRGQRFWPEKLGGDKGYSYPHIRRWLWRRHIEAVIPTRKDQPRIETFDKASYRQRNLIERVVGWFKECRRLGTRYEKLAVNYVALWMVAMIEKILRLGRSIGKHHMSDSA
jgi:transposase